MLTNGVDHAFLRNHIVGDTLRQEVRQFGDLVVPCDFGQLVGNDVSQRTEKEDPMEPAVVEERSAASPLDQEGVGKTQVEVVGSHLNFGIIVGDAVDYVFR